MPTFDNPKFVHVEPRNGIPIGPLLILGAVGYAVWQVLAWLATVEVACYAVIGATAVAAAAGGVTVLWRERGTTFISASQSPVQRLDASRGASPAAIPVRPATAISARSQPAIEAPAVIHNHLHLHAIEEKP